jgi:hypothetical protein
MPSRLPDSIKDAAIEKWLLGYSRNTIAIECNISTGAVSSITENWSHSVGPDLANLLRGLAVTLRKLGMSPAQCAFGLRTVNLIDKMGFDVNSIESFLSEVYSRLVELDVNPKFIARYVEGLNSFVDELNLAHGERTKAISMQRIDTIFEKKKRYNMQLGDEFRLRKARLEETDWPIDENEKKLHDLQEKNRILEQEIGWKSQLRDDLQKYGLDVSNISRLVEGARFFSDNSYSVSEMQALFSSYKEMFAATLNQRAMLENLKDSSNKIRQYNLIEEDLLQQRRLKNAELDSLKSMGFGLQELKTLRNLIVEFASENDYSTEKGEAVRNFISDIEGHHHDYVCLRKRIENLKNIESIIINFNVMASQLGLACKAFVNRKGVTQDDIKNIAKIMEIYPPGRISNAEFELLLKQREEKHDDEADPADGSSINSPDSPVVDGNANREIGKPLYPRPPRIPRRLRPRDISLDDTTATNCTVERVKTSFIRSAHDPEVLIPHYTIDGVDAGVGHEKASLIDLSSQNISSNKEKIAEGLREVQGKPK